MDRKYKVTYITRSLTQTNTLQSGHQWHTAGYNNSKTWRFISSQFFFKYGGGSQFEHWL